MHKQPKGIVQNVSVKLSKKEDMQVILRKK